MDCLFCNIIAGKIPAKKIFESDQLVAFPDIHPAADIHILIVPKKHIRKLQEIDEVMKLANPRDQKIKLAYEITNLYHGSKKAATAQQAFISQFSKGELPEDIQTIKAISGMASEILVAAKLASSKSEAKRLIAQGGVKVDGEVLTDDVNIDVNHVPKLVQVGKRKYIKIQKE